MNSVSFSICSLIYIIIFLIVYFGKKRIDLEENKIYSTLLIATTIGLIIDIIGYISFRTLEMDSIFNIIVSKMYLIYYFTWAFVITIYTIITSLKKSIKKIIDKIVIFYISMCSIILILPINFQTTKYALYSYGPSVNFVYLFSGICIVTMLACLAIKRKSIKKRKYIPLFVLIVSVSVVVLIQKIWPELLLITFVKSIVTALMYFTIENPDVQMVEELNKNKKLTEQNFEEKTNFLFKISQELKKPLQDIANISSDIYENTNGEIKEQAKQINTNSKQLYSYVNNALDISTMDIKNLKIVDGIYNAKNFFDEINLRIKSEIKNQNKNIDFRYNISKNIPEYLQGDNTKLKQAVASITFDCIRNTEKGFIELNIDSITRYGMCRLLIEISDSGRGMELEKINEILSVSQEIKKEEIEKIDKLSISLPLAHKIIKALNGSLMIKSEVNSGTTFLIVIDQKIENKKDNSKKTLEKYSNNKICEAQIIMITNNIEIIKETKKELEDINIVSSPFVKESIEQIKRQNFKCVIIDEDLNEESGINILEEIKKIGKNIPTICLISEKNKFLEKHYIEDGFDEFITKENYLNQIEKIKKHL